MKLISRKEFVDWIMEQPDDRPVDMGSSFSSDTSCGCLMVQYGREVLRMNNYFSCGFSRFIARADDEDAVFDGFSISDIVPLLDGESFGEIKKGLKHEN